MGLGMDGFGLEHNSQYEGRTRDYVRGIMRTCQSSEHVGFYEDERSP